MNPSLSLLFVKKMNEICGLDNTNLIYSLLPCIDQKLGSKGRHGGISLNELPMIVDTGIQVFTNKNMNVPKSSAYYMKLEEEKESLFNTLAMEKHLLGLKEFQVGSDKKRAMFATISSMYFNNYITPAQFFLPSTSLFSGHWKFWDKVNYTELMKKAYKKETTDLVTKELSKNETWKTKFSYDDFPEIIKRRLIKENAFEKKLDPDAMIKAIIIKLGELGIPPINYEIVDYSIRHIFTYLAVSKYLRVDREILFLRRFEERLENTIQ